MSAIPENTASFSWAEVASICGGVSRGELSGQTVLEGVGTDTRAPLAGKLFVALRGERFDAHELIGEAARAGARAALVERPIDGSPLPLLEVESTLAALGALGRAHRRRYRGKLVAVAGSAGKTTTRAAIGALLELCAPGRVHQVRGNLNNLIGVPHVLLGLRDDQPLAVIEIGTNMPGEVATLCAQAEPDVAVLTLIGVEHSEGLGDLDAIEREEGALFAALGAGQTAVANVDDERVLRQFERSPAGTKLGYGFGPRALVRGLSRELRGAKAQLLRVDEGGRKLELEVPLLGQAGAYATLAALTVIAALGLRLEQAGPAVSAALAGAGEPGRLRALELADGSLVLDDTYNSNPASVSSSLAAARELAGARSARLLLVLGEMRELGASSAGEHQKLGQELANSGAAALIAVSGDAELMVEPARAGGVDARFAADTQLALSFLLECQKPGDVVLVKASRGVRAERVVEGLVAARGRAA